MTDFFRYCRRQATDFVPLLPLYFAIIAWAIWMGGFMFYFGVVVPLGGAIVGGSEQGFVTQQVTFRLNVIGAVALAMMVWMTWRSKSRLLIGTWIVMSLCQVALFLMHHQLDLLINFPAREIIDQARFVTLHESYEGLSTIQWTVAMAHLLGILRITAKSC